jgi:large subunit ribosomal protein L30
MADKLKITLVKSPIGAVPKHRKTVEAMTRLYKTVELPDNACTRGQIKQIDYMVKVEEA